MSEENRHCNIDMHNHVIERINRNETRLNEHSKRIDKLEINQERTDVTIQNVLDKLSEVSKSLTWMVRLGFTIILGIIIKLIESKLF